MDTLEQQEPFRLSPQTEIAIPFENGRIVVKADQRAFKERVLAPLSISDEQKSAWIKEWNEVNSNSLQIGGMRTYLEQWPFSIKKIIDQTSVAGIAPGVNVNIDPERIIRCIRFKPDLSMEVKLMTIKQSIDAVLRHEEQHVRQYLEKRLTSPESIKNSRLFTRLESAGIGAIGLSPVFLLLGAANATIIDKALSYVAYQLNKGEALSPDELKLAKVILEGTSIAIPITEGTLIISGVVGLSGLTAACFGFYKSRYGNWWEKEAEEQRKPQYFNSKSPLEVSFER